MHHLFVSSIIIFYHWWNPSAPGRHLQGIFQMCGVFFSTNWLFEVEVTSFDPSFSILILFYFVFLFQIAPLIVSNEKNSLYCSKWVCPVCTYLNWPKSTKCIECLTVRKVKISPTRSSSPSCSLKDYSGRDLSFPSSIKTEIHNNCDSYGSGSSAGDIDIVGRLDELNIGESNRGGIVGNVSGCTSTSSASDSYHNDRNRVYTNVFQKWRCSMCAYENWPKALKCTLCLYRRDLNSNDGPRNSPSPPGAQGWSFQTSLDQWQRLKHTWKRPNKIHPRMTIV